MYVCMYTTMLHVLVVGMFVYAESVIGVSLV